MATQSDHNRDQPSELWRPSATKDTIKARGLLLQQVRQFFEQRDVLEVDTPILSQHGTTDPYIESIQTPHGILQTSPEFAMKRLLCADVGSIYQISKAFRQEESGRWHNPEFTMLEWYRVGFTHLDLIKEVDAFLSTTLGTETADIISYQQIFLDALSLDPLSCADNDLNQTIDDSQLLSGRAEVLSRDDKLNLLFSHFIEPEIGLNRPSIVVDFPASQSALARINQHDPRIADRFEAYYKGIELANGFYELADASEQLQRFQADNAERQRKCLSEMPIDSLLIEALSHGLPECAGVALGLDRLLMLKVNASHINEVICFPYNGA